MEKVLVIIIILISVVLNAVGQVSLKYGMNLYGGVDFSDFKRIFLMFFQPFVFIGLCSYVLSTVFWLVSLSNADLSFVYPTVTLSIVLVVFMSRFVFQEYFNLTKFAGIFFILLGASLLGLGKIKS